MNKERKNNRGPLLKVVGQCPTNDKYGHEYINCSNCKVNKEKRCEIIGCPCSGKGYLFSVEGDPNCFSHQIPGHINSTRVYLNHPKKPIKSVQSGIKKNNRIHLNNYSLNRHRTSVTERIKNGTFHTRKKRSKRFR